MNRLLGRWGIGIECPPYLDAKSLTEQAIRWLEQVPGPFFLWIQYMDVHIPYNLQDCAALLPKALGQRPYEYGFWQRAMRNPEQLTQRDLALAQRLYSGGIAFVDRQIDHLCHALSNIGHLEQTTFVVTADHGEEFCEHGLFGHRSHLYEESIHVPLIISPVDTVDRPRFPRQVRHLDLAPTLIELAGGTPPPEMQGASLISSLEGEKEAKDLPAISQTHPSHYHISLREPPWKMIWRVNPNTLRSHNVELYHLDDDPAEKNDLSEQLPERVASMQNKLKKHISQLDFAQPNAEATEEFDTRVRERLVALGYLTDE
jgi:arylsulfatase A-like enzyme